MGNSVSTTNTAFQYDNNISSSVMTDNEISNKLPKLSNKCPKEVNICSASFQE